MRPMRGPAWRRIVIGAVALLVPALAAAWRWGPLASNLRPILEYLALFILLLVAYVLLWHSDVSTFWLNCGTLLLAVAVVLVNLITDLLAARLDPRIRLQ